MIEAKPQNPLAKKLADIRRAAEERDAERRAAKFGLPYVNLGKAPVALEAVRLVPEGEAKTAQLAAIEMKSGEVAVACFDPKSAAAEKVLESLRRHHRVRLFVASLSGLEQAWYFYRFVSADQKEITGQVAIEKTHFEELLHKLVRLDDVKAELAKDDQISTTNLLEIVLAGALNTRASDLHFEAEEKGARIRYRIDGLLHDACEALSYKHYENLVSRLKLLSGLKMNVHGEPQDGRFTIKLPAKEIEMRVSIIPSEFGETIVMRVLDPDAIKVDMAGLGLRPDDLAIVRSQLERPNGLILNTGPTGSGKTTTLYTFLQELADPESKIITVEDPIEYRIQGIEQTQVNPEVGYTFAGGLRAILRQDPDVILVGEIRDQETADIALQASLTGHLVLSTLHTNDAVGAIPRLMDLGVKPMTIGPALSMVIAQRLVRRLCPDCRKPREVAAEEKERIARFVAALPARVDRAPYAEPKLYEPGGCAKCGNFGFKGRIGIFEFFLVTPAVQELILKEVSQIALAKIAAEQEMVGMQADGVLKSLLGVTTLEEVIGTTGPIAWPEAGKK